MLGLELAERGLLPDAVVRAGIRSILRDRLREIEATDCERERERHQAFLAEARRAPIALATDAANAQHYEVPAELFELVLGPHLKYSCAHFGPGTTDLAEAEARMLALVAERAQLEDGQRILDLGCGWGSFSLWAAKRHPKSRLLAVSNSKSQAEFIRRRADRDGIRNLEVVTADVNVFDAEERFDRIVSVEMFEHVRNHGALLARIATWLDPKGLLFVHHFAHRSAAYPYTTEGEDDWMGRYFFTGGMMPSDDWLLAFQDDLAVRRRWCVSGVHYQKTSDAWLANLDRRRSEALPVLRATYGAGQEALWLQRWRIFFLACSELFGFRGGQEWWVTHAILGPRERTR
ncbi:MAG: cyclopropane-fatty-acyl-phospholipid synthase family protein [Myxococcota bacterium]